MFHALGCERELSKSPKQVHDIAITGVSALTRSLKDYTVPVIVNIENQGDCAESFDVKLIDVTEDKDIGTKSVRLFPAGEDGLGGVADLILTGENTGDFFGGYNFTGDVNGDGYDDLLVGASRYNENQGRIYLYLGGPDMDGVPDMILTGEHSGDYFGEMGPMGDVNRDGYDDIIIGAPGYGNWRGRVYIYPGGPDVKKKAVLILDEEKKDSWFGGSIAVGDINNDGYEDIFVSAYHYNNQTGRVYLYYGGEHINKTPDKIFDGEHEGELYGRCIYNQNKIADVDGDGYGDILISSRNWNRTQGRAYLYYGGPGTTMDTNCDELFTGENLGDDFGVSGVLFDIDDDGHADVLIGARKWPAGAMQGRVYLYWGSNRATFDNIPDLTFNGEADATATFGGDCVGVGYVNDDRYADMVITAYDYYRFSQHGRTYLFYGGTNSSIDDVSDWVVTGETPGNLIMNAVIADFNGDKYGDIGMGGWGYPYMEKQGRVWLYFGGRSPSTDLTFYWDTTRADRGEHTLKATIDPVAREKDIADNTVTKTINLTSHP